MVRKKDLKYPLLLIMVIFSSVYGGFLMYDILTAGPLDLFSVIIFLFTLLFVAWIYSIAISHFRKIGQE
jgi:hypothetical protein